MRAVAFLEFGGPEVLRVVEVPEPIAGAGELVVKVVASAVNPTDTLMRGGAQAAMMAGLPPPHIPGVEFAGHVHRVGDTGSSFAVGQPVMGLVNARRRDGGSHAEYVRVAAVSVAPLSASVDIVQAAALPMAGLTAMLALEALDLRPGDTLLVTGGAGAVGGYAIQLAKRANLRVAADAKDTDAQNLRELGADIVVPRGDRMEAELRRYCPGGVDGLIDGALLGDRAAAVVRDGGASVSLRRSHGISDPRLHRHQINVFDAASAAALSRLATLFMDRAVTPRVALRLSFEEAAHAHRLVEQGGLRGRVVLMPHP